MRFHRPLSLLTLCIVGFLPACTHMVSGLNGNPEKGLTASQFAKTDMDRVADGHRQQTLASLRLLAEKLYRRNPNEWKKGGQPNLEAALKRLFADPAWRFDDLKGKMATDAILLGLREDYSGDRVLAVIAGLGGMLNLAFNGKEEFFIHDDLNAQMLYNAARNLEIAAWKLSNAKDSKGNLLLVSNELGPVPNLSFEREFGKMIGGLDILAKLFAEKNNRMIVKVSQSVATAVFLPITLLR